jgi:hypothetical protein
MAENHLCGKKVRPANFPNRKYYVCLTDVPSVPYTTVKYVPGLSFLTWHSREMNFFGFFFCQNGRPHGRGSWAYHRLHLWQL